MDFARMPGEDNRLNVPGPANGTEELLATYSATGALCRAPDSRSSAPLDCPAPPCLRADAKDDSL